jgi:hypothetical protein
MTGWSLRGLACVAALAMGGCEFGRAFGGGDLVASYVEHFSPPAETYFPFEKPFPLAGRDPVTSSGGGRISFLGAPYRYSTTRTDIVIRQGRYSRPLPVHIYEHAGATQARCAANAAGPACGGWLLMFEADIIGDGEYSSLSPRRVPIDSFDRQCLVFRFASGSGPEAVAAAVAQAGEPFASSTVCLAEQQKGEYDRASGRFTPG